VVAEKVYQVGIAALYRQLNIPVVPVALNSGLFWGRHAMLWPGRCRARFLPAISPGLGAEAFMAQLEFTIEAETTRLIAEAVALGQGRPVDAGFRDRLSAAQAGGSARP